MKLFLNSYALVPGKNCSACVLNTDEKTCDKLRPICLKNTGMIFIQVSEIQKIIFEQLEKLDIKLNELSLRITLLQEKWDEDAQ